MDSDRFYIESVKLWKVLQGKELWLVLEVRYWVSSYIHESIVQNR